MYELDLNFGATVLLSDGKAGKLCAVAIDTKDLQVTHLIVEDGLLLKKARAFPFTLVAQSGDDLALTIASAGVEDFPPYREETVEIPAQGGGYSSASWTNSGGYQVATAPPMSRVKMRYGVPEDRAVLKPGAAVSASDGKAGKLDHLIVEAATGAITQVVLQQGSLFLSRHVLPVEMVESISNSGIFLDAAHDQLEGLPDYEAAAFAEREPE